MPAYARHRCWDLQSCWLMVQPSYVLTQVDCILRASIVTYCEHVAIKRVHQSAPGIAVMPLYMGQVAATMPAVDPESPLASPPPPSVAASDIASVLLPASPPPSLPPSSPPLPLLLPLELPLLLPLVLPLELPLLLPLVLPLELPLLLPLVLPLELPLLLPLLLPPSEPPLLLSLLHPWTTLIPSNVNIPLTANVRRRPIFRPPRRKENPHLTPAQRYRRKLVQVNQI